MPTLFSTDRDYTDRNLARGGRVGLLIAINHSKS
jgi:hypothetical protein